MDLNRQPYSSNHNRRPTYVNTNAIGNSTYGNNANLMPHNQSPAPPKTVVIENPYEQAQNALFERIVNNMAKLNDVVKEANRGLTEINMKNMNVELTVQMWQKYERNASFYLHETNQLQPLSSITDATTSNPVNRNNDDINSKTKENHQEESELLYSHSDSDLEPDRELNNSTDNV